MQPREDQGGGRAPAHHEDVEWPELSIRVSISRPRIRASVYTARSVSLEAIKIFRRHCLVLHFDVFDGDYSAGRVVARIPLYLRLPERGRPLAPSSKLARLFDLAGVQVARRDRLPMNALRNRLWRVEVGDVTTSYEKDPMTGQPRLLADSLRYSVVRAVVEHIA